MVANQPSWVEPAVATAGALPQDLAMDTVELFVRDLDAMTEYYHRAVLLEVLAHDGPTAILGRGGNPILTLRQDRNLPPSNSRDAGLYHTAILFQGAAELSASLLSMFHRVPRTYTGSADHLVSEAFYFTDPEGNGLELYHDRPRSDWREAPGGGVRMASLPLDPVRFIETWHNPEAVLSGPSATVGHVHLQVGDIETAKHFYVDQLGFDVTAHMGTALFISAGGYHHHLGMNTWHSKGAGPRAAALGLGDVRIGVPSRADVEEIASRLRHHGVQSDDDGRSLRFKDPWGTALVVTPSGN